MKPLRIALLTSAPFPAREGIGTYVKNLAIELQAAGHEPTVITRGRAGRGRRRVLDGLPIVELPFFATYPIHVQVHGRFVARYLARHAAEFDVVNAHSPLVPIVGRDWPLVTTLHSRLVADANATSVDDLRSLLIRLQTPVSARLERALLRRSSAVAVVNGLIAAELAAELERGVPVVVRTNGVNPERFQPASAIRRGHDVLAVGRLVHGKGFEDLLLAWQTVARNAPSARLTIVGQGPLMSRLVELAASLGITSTVRFAGELSGTRSDELIGLYQAARVVVQPSHHEGLSTVVLEAMACAAAVVATDVGAHSTVISEGRNGRLVAAREPAALAAALSELLANPSLAHSLGSQARQTIVDRFSWPAIASAYIDLFGSLQGAARRAN
jgi:glycosyltransferase involved in cell wall biosynthesis